MNKIERLLDSWEQTAEPKIKSFQGLTLAWSGGPDSTALFHLFCRVAKQKNIFRFSVNHINYRLRGAESDEDQRFVEEASKDSNVPIRVYRVSDDELLSLKQGSTQKLARELRYKFFLQNSPPNSLIVTGHHRDDLAENAVFRMIRGSSPGNLAGMTELSPPFWRPLLSCSKEEILAYLNQHKVTYRHDRSNDRIGYSRNFIRHEILPQFEKLFPGAKNRIAALAIEAQELELDCKLRLQSQISSYEDGKIPQQFFMELADPLAFLALRIMLEDSKKGMPPNNISRSIFADILARIRRSAPGDTGWALDVPGGLVFRYGSGSTWIEKDRQNQKMARALQHKRNIERINTRVILEPHASCEIPSTKNDVYINNDANTESLSKNLYIDNDVNIEKMVD